MPPQTNTDLIRELYKITGDLESQITLLKSEIQIVQPMVTLQRVAVLEAQVAELTKSRDESARRVAQLVLLAVGAGFTVIVQLLIKFASK